MRSLVLFVVLVAAACRAGPLRNTLRPDPEVADSLYWRAVAHLDASNTRGSTDSAMYYLNLYLSNGSVQKHRVEANTFRQLARDALLLARVQGALNQTKAADTVAKTKADNSPRGRDEEAIKEIQRLRDELAKANEELERIKKRLANPKPPG